MIYKTLAGYYDALVQDEEAISAWVDWIESFHPGPRFLELACGTGEITLRLARHHSVDALDLSNEMIAVAAHKDTQMAINFYDGDMRDLEGFGLYDAIGCFCDSINYILSQDDLSLIFAQAADHLLDGGLFLFDMHSMDRLDEFRDPYEEAGNFDDGTQLQWVIESSEDMIFQDFAFYFPEGTVAEHHRQKVYSPDVILSLLDEHFDVISVMTDFNQPGIVPGEKTFIACRKKAAQ